MAKKPRYEKLFEPGKIGKIVTRNRIMMAPMNLNYTEDPYRFSQRYIDAIEARAKGGVGTIITAHVKAESEIDPYPAAGMPAALDREANFRIFAELAEAAHRYGAKIILQLSAGTGRLADVAIREKWPASPSALSMLLYPHLFTRELTIGEISALVEAYGKAAGKARAAGFDAVMVHCGGSYLIGQFLSAKWNKRTDKYGGSPAARMRFMEECIESARSMAGRDFPLLALVSAHSMLEGAFEPEEAKPIARRLEELGIAGLLLRTGSYDSRDWIIPPIYYPRGCRTPYTQPVKDAVSVPVIIDGRIDTPEVAEKLLMEGKADFIGLGRPLLADPDWAKKAEQGRPDDIRTCIVCNECYNRVLSRKYAKCAVNPALSRERDYRYLPASNPKKVIVVGGGPGGMRAATVAALRGHKVTLYEKTPRLGGNMIAASSPEFKMPMRPIIGWMAEEAKRAGAKIELGKEVTAKTLIGLKPDTVILATGSAPWLPDIPGIKGKNVTTAVAVLLGKAKIADDVVVVGGGHVGCETALHLARMGKKVTIIEMLPDIALDAGGMDRAALMKLLPEAGVKWSVCMRCVSIGKTGVMACDKDGVNHKFKAGSVVLSVGMVCNDALYEEVKGKVAELYKIGDAVQSRKVFDAVHDGEAIASLI
ncbi:MAG: FAD-dependent oxidoreductase [Chloroflexi bacterium]|nr:FAD-dependent oxidoreductase [Chloroflexota bacterium]